MHKAIETQKKNITETGRKVEREKEREREKQKSRKAEKIT